MFVMDGSKMSTRGPKSGAVIRLDFTAGSVSARATTAARLRSTVTSRIFMRCRLVRAVQLIDLDFALFRKATSGARVQSATETADILWPAGVISGGSCFNSAGGQR